MHPYGALQYVIQHVVHNIICLGIAVRLGSDASASAQVLEQQLNTLPPLLTIVWQCQTGTHHSYNCVSVFLCVCLFVALVQMCLCFFRELWSPFDIASRCWCLFCFSWIPLFSVLFSGCQWLRILFLGLLFVFCLHLCFCVFFRLELNSCVSAWHCSGLAILTIQPCWNLSLSWQYRLCFNLW